LVSPTHILKMLIENQGKLGCYCSFPIPAQV
jgi:hypothetical protein